MGIHDGSKLFSLRVHNKTRSCILLKQFPGNIWSMPIIEMPYEADPIDYLDDVLEQVDHNGMFKVISAVSMVDYVKEDSNGVEHHSVIYDLRYSGTVYPGLTQQTKYEFVKSQWMQKGMLGNLKGFNYPLGAYCAAMEKETCLR